MKKLKVNVDVKHNASPAAHFTLVSFQRVESLKELHKSV